MELVAADTAVVDDQPIRFEARKLQPGGGELADYDIRKCAVHFGGQIRITAILPPRLVKAIRDRQIIGRIRKARALILMAKTLNDAQIPITVLPGWLDHRSLAKIVPGHNLNHGGGIGHRSKQCIGQSVSARVIESAVGRSDTGLLINVMKPRKTAADRGRPRGRPGLEIVEV